MLLKIWSYYSALRLDIFVVIILLSLDVINHENEYFC